MWIIVDDLSDTCWRWKEAVGRIPVAAHVGRWDGVPGIEAAEA